MGYGSNGINNDGTFMNVGNYLGARPSIRLLGREKGYDTGHAMAALLGIGSNLELKQPARPTSRSGEEESSFRRSSTFSASSMSSQQGAQPRASPQHKPSHAGQPPPYAANGQPAHHQFHHRQNQHQHQHHHHHHHHHHQQHQQQRAMQQPPQSAASHHSVASSCCRGSAPATPAHLLPAAGVSRFSRAQQQQQQQQQQRGPAACRSRSMSTDSGSLGSVQDSPRCASPPSTRAGVMPLRVGMRVITTKNIDLRSGTVLRRGVMGVVCKVPGDIKGTVAEVDIPDGPLFDAWPGTVAPIPTTPRTPSVPSLDLSFKTRSSSCSLSHSQINPATMKAAGAGS
eukprot:gene12556-19441_t